MGTEIKMVDLNLLVLAFDAVLFLFGEKQRVKPGCLFRLPLLDLFSTTLFPWSQRTTSESLFARMMDYLMWSGLVLPIYSSIIRLSMENETVYHDWSNSERCSPRYLNQPHRPTKYLRTIPYLGSIRA